MVTASPPAQLRAASQGSSLHRGAAAGGLGVPARPAWALCMNRGGPEMPVVVVGSRWRWEYVGMCACKVISARRGKPKTALTAGGNAGSDVKGDRSSDGQMTGTIDGTSGSTGRTQE